MKPHLYAINMNGMDRDGERRGRKILPVGQGELDLELLRAIQQSGYRGPIGILGHAQDDAELRLRDNLDGLAWLVNQLEGRPPVKRPTPHTPMPERTPAAAPELSSHRVLIQGNDKIAIVAADGSIEWQMPWGPIHDVHVLPNGRIMAPSGSAAIAEIDPQTKGIVWSHDSATSPANRDRHIEVHAFQPLEDGRVMIAESGAGRIIEISRAGVVEKEIPLQIDHPDPHRDTRLARKLSTGNYLVCHEGDGAVREYDGQSGRVVWEYRIPLFDQMPRDGHGPEAFGNQVFAAVRLRNGNTLISTGNGHSVLEVAPNKDIVWKLQQHDLPGIVLAWVTTLEILPNGHYVIGNCHAGPDNPQLIEIEPQTKSVVWTFDRFEAFGNAVSNTQILDIEDKVLR
jgi:hypothetical protein